VAAKLVAPCSVHDTPLLSTTRPTSYQTPISASTPLPLETRTSETLLALFPTEECWPMLTYNPLAHLCAPLLHPSFTLSVAGGPSPSPGIFSCSHPQHTSTDQAYTQHLHIHAYLT